MTRHDLKDDFDELVRYDRIGRELGGLISDVLPDLCLELFRRLVCHAGK